MHRLTKENYWKVVRECLAHFHGISPRDALQVVQAVEHLMEDNYERDPFYVACDLKNEPLKLQDHIGPYLKILHQYY